MPMVSMIVFFNPDSIPSEGRTNLAARRKVVEDGIRTLRQQFPDLKVGPPIAMSCAVGIQATHVQLPDIIEFLESSNLGILEFDGEMIHAARGEV